MNDKQLQKLDTFIEESIISYRNRIADRIASIKLREILGKNPYLYNTLYGSNKSEYIIKALNDFLTSSHETTFGNKMEEIAIFANSIVYGGFKPNYPSIDLQFANPESVINLVGIKSSPRWGNADSIAKMIENLTDKLGDFNKKQVKLVNACLSGKTRDTTNPNYTRYCGKAAWKFLTGHDQTYRFVMSCISKTVSKNNSGILSARLRKQAQLIEEFEKEFCENNQINWEKIIDFNSSNKRKENEK